jgi:hypothetical protein
MKQLDILKPVIQEIRNNPFSRCQSGYSLYVNDFLIELAATLDRNKVRDNPLFNKLTKELTKDEIEVVWSHITDSIPGFQRDNDKWTEERQSKYIWNLLRGNKGQAIVLYNTQDNEAKWWILDGLQRITAIVRFLTDETFFVKTKYGDFNCAQLRASTPAEQVPSVGSVLISKNNFESHVSACEHYIEINEGITHSEKDIQRARDFIAANQK